MISVCMATFNGQNYLFSQIESILNQLSGDDELIISDDGSTDLTLNVIQSFNDKRIKLFHHCKIRNVNSSKRDKFYFTTSNFENALKHAKGDYIFLADQDDIWLPHKKQIMLEYLQKFELVMCNFSIINQDGDILVDKYYNSSPLSKSRFINTIKSKFLGCCIAFNRSLLEKALPFPEKLIAHDYWLGCLSGCNCFIDIVSHQYRRYDNNVSTSTQKSKNSFLFKIAYRINFGLELIKRLLKDYL